MALTLGDFLGPLLPKAAPPLPQEKQSIPSRAVADATPSTASTGENSQKKKPLPPPPKVVDPWNDRMQSLTSWFLEHVHELPTEPFQRGPGISVSDPAKFYLALRVDIESSPTGPRGRTGVLEDELTALLQCWAIQREENSYDSASSLPN